jgi:hypothetical protein
VFPLERRHEHRVGDTGCGRHEYDPEDHKQHDVYHLEHHHHLRHDLTPRQDLQIGQRRQCGEPRHGLPHGIDVSRVNHHLVRLVVHRKKLARVVERHHDPEVVHYVHRGGDDLGHREEPAGDGPVDVLPDQGELRTRLDVVPACEAAANQHAALPHEPWSFEPRQQTRVVRLGVWVYAHDEAHEPLFRERREDGSVDARRHVLDGRIRADLIEHVADAIYREVDGAIVQPPLRVYLCMSDHRARDGRVELAHVAVHQRGDGQKDELTERDRGKGEGRPFLVSTQVPPGDAECARNSHVASTSYRVGTSGWTARDL